MSQYMTGYVETLEKLNESKIKRIAELERENAALREELKASRKLIDTLIIKADAFDYLAWLEKKRGEELQLQGVHFLCLTSGNKTCWGKTYLEAVRIAEQQDRIAFDNAARKETGDDAIMRQHLNEGGTPT